MGAIVGVVAAVLLGPAGFALVGSTMAGMIGGAIGGAIAGGLDGGWKGALIGGALGGALGGLGGWAVGGVAGTIAHPVVLAGLFAGGVGNAAATGRWDSFAGGVVGAIGGAVAGQGIVNAYSQQFANYRAGNGFVSNATLAARQAGQGGNLQGLADQQYRMSISVREGATGKAQLGNTGHAWVTLDDGENTTSYGYWPDGLHTTSGYYDGMAPNSSLTYVLSKGQYGNVVQYINNVATQTSAGNMHWTLSVDCVDFVSGAARAASIPVPSTTTTTLGVFSYSDPNKLEDWLVNKQ